MVATGDWIEQMLGEQAYLVDLCRPGAWRVRVGALGRYSSEGARRVGGNRFTRLRLSPRGSL